MFFFFLYFHPSFNFPGILVGQSATVCLPVKVVSLNLQEQHFQRGGSNTAAHHKEHETYSPLRPPPPHPPPPPPPSAHQLISSAATFAEIALWSISLFRTQESERESERASKKKNLVRCYLPAPHHPTETWWHINEKINNGTEKRVGFLFAGRNSKRESDGEREGERDGGGEEVGSKIAAVITGPGLCKQQLHKEMLKWLLPKEVVVLLVVVVGCVCV